MISERSKRAGIKELKIFDNFRVDENLPKYKGEEKVVKAEGSAFYFMNDDSNSIMVRNTNTNPTSIGVDENWDDSSIDYNKPSFGKRFKALFFPNLFRKLVQKQRKKNNLVTIRNFFINLADHFNELTPIADIADHYEKAIKQARTLGQWSLAEQLEDKLDVVRSEAHLIQMGITKYVTNEQVCDFYENVGEDKNLKLTWIEHFVKIIPNDIIEIKEKIDKRGLFDNYVVLHYDPNNDATSLTKEEIETKKDPILFGVIKNSKRLYYVGDWVDEYCDLTLDKMFEKLGERVLEINNRNLKTYIDKGGDYELKRKKKRKSKKSK